MIVVDEQAALVLPEDCVALVRALIQQYAPHHKFFAFGSRVVRSAADRQRVKPHSDLDLAISGEPLPLDKMFLLRDAFSESNLPMRVDIVHTSDLPEGWKIQASPL
ncbi:MAG: nucleotidyltransferase domain-containing protein [Aeromicrobium sp.]|nr:nucleotidyltransferase domain-containing protein [Burkholderiales bacterium]